MASLVVFDLDRTIVRFGTYTPFLLRYALKHAPWRLIFAPVVLACMIGYKLKLTDRAGLKQIMFRLLVGKPTVDHMKAYAEAFADDVVARHCFEEALKVIETHREAGDTLLLATASFAFYASAIAERLGFDHTIGTLIEEEDGHYLARVVGANCYGDDKRRMVTEFLAKDLNDTRPFIFYTDDKSDIPLLEVAASGILVNPKPKLTRWSEKRGNMKVVRWQ